MERKKLIIFLVVSFVFIFHLTMTVLFLLPPNPMVNSYRDLVNWYTNPLFQQNWLLFAPEPPTDDRYLWYRCGKNESWGPWQEPGTHLFSQMTINPIGFEHKLFRAYEGVMRKLANAMVEQSNKGLSTDKQNLLIQKEPIFVLAKKIIGSLCIKDNPTFSRIQFRIAVVPIRPYSKRFDKTENVVPRALVEFPVVQLYEY